MNITAKALAKNNKSPKNSFSSRRNLWLGILISAACLAVAVRKVDFDEVGLALRSAHYSYFLYSSILTLVACLLRTLRWKFLLSPFKTTKFSSLLSAIMIGFLGNNILPARLGELIKAYLVGNKENLSKSLSLGTIVADRMLDIFALLLFLLISLIYYDFPAWVGHVARLGVLALFVGCITVIIGFYNRQRFAHWIRTMVSPFSETLSKKVSEIFENFVVGFSVMRFPSYLSTSILLSFLIWIVLAWGINTIFACLDLHLSFGSAFIIMAIVNLGLTIPSSPGFVGTFQFFCIQALLLFGVHESQGLTFSIIYHLTQFVPTTLVGLIFLFRENLGLRSLAESAAKTGEHGGEKVDTYPVTSL